VRRLVLDPGVLVSALITPSGPPAALWRAARAGRIVLIVSPALLAELAEVLRRDKFRRYTSTEEADKFFMQVARRGVPFLDPPAVPGVTPDPKDDYLVALAQVGQADALVSGDRAVLGARVPGLSIVTPRTAVEDLA
jgi:putative PIN family toxin of toxin-antitoxin system